MPKGKKPIIHLMDGDTEIAKFGSKTLAKIFNDKSNYGKTYTLCMEEPDKTQGVPPITTVGPYTVLSKSGGPPGPVDTPPKVDAGADIDVKPGDVVTLDGSATDNVGGSIKSQEWTGPDDIVLTPVPGDASKATFTAPGLNEGEDIRGLVFTFSATDDTGHTSTDQSIVNVKREVKNPPPPPPPVTGISDVSHTWNNGHARTITNHGEFDPDDSKVELRAGTNRKAVFDGHGNCTISGDQARIYCHYPCYNSILTLDYVPNMASSGDDLSLKLRSRHNEKENGASNFIGGIGFSTELGAWKSKIEIVHGATEPVIGSGNLTKKLENGKKYKIRFTVKDEGVKKIRVLAEIDFGNGYEVQENELYTNAPDTFFDKALIESLSYFWIRNNGSGSVTVSNVKLETL